MTYQEKPALISDIKEKLLVWFNNTLPENYIWKGVGESITPHYLLHCSPLRVIGQDYIGKKADDHGNILIQGTREATLTVAYLGSNAIDKINKVITLFHRPSTLEALYHSDIVLVDMSEVTEEVLPTESTFDKRASVSITIRTEDIYLDTTGYYTSASINGAAGKMATSVVVNPSAS